MKKPSRGKAVRPAQMPQKPKRPDPVAAEEAKKALGDDTRDRREAASAYLESERAARGTGVDVPDLGTARDPR